MQVILSIPTPSATRSIAVSSDDFVAMLTNGEDFAWRLTGFLSGCPCYTAYIPLAGGKGGFGKLLKSQKNIGKKTDNFDSCRDLQGRRIRSANRDEKLQKFKEQKEKEDKIVESLQSSSSSLKPAVSLDEKYSNQLVQIEKQKVSAVIEGMRVSATSQNTTALKPAPKAKKLILFDDESISD